MAAGATFEIHGLAEVDAALGEMSRAAARGVMRRVLRRAAKPIMLEMKRRAPVAAARHHGRDPGALRDSIRIINDKAPRSGGGAYSQALRSGASAGEEVAALIGAARSLKATEQGPPLVSVSVRAFGPHAYFAEFGTEHHGAQPFIVPTWEGGKRKALSDILSDMWGEIERTAARAAARAARKAAKAPR